MSYLLFINLYVLAPAIEILILQKQSKTHVVSQARLGPIEHNNLLYIITVTYLTPSLHAASLKKNTHLNQGPSGPQSLRHL